MKLNPNCMRDIMLSLEELTGIQCRCYEKQKIYSFKQVYWETVARSLADKHDYSAEEIQYTLIQLYESGYIHMEYKIEKGKPQLGNIFYLSPKGHDFVASVKKEEGLKRLLQIPLSIIETVTRANCLANHWPIQMVFL